MSAATDLPDEIVIEELAYLKHRFPAFPRDDAIPIEPPKLSALELFGAESGVAFRGTLTNTSTLAVSDPQVSVFTLNAVGRPLGVTTASEPVDIGAGESWIFETQPIDQAGAEQMVYASVTFQE